MSKTHNWIFPQGTIIGANSVPLGTAANPIPVNDTKEYPKEYQNRPYIWVLVNGQLTKWYRSYSDYYA